MLAQGEEVPSGGISRIGGASSDTKTNLGPLTVGGCAICQFLVLWFSLPPSKGPAASPSLTAAAEAGARGGQEFHIW